MRQIDALANLSQYIDPAIDFRAYLIDRILKLCQSVSHCVGVY